MAVDCGVELKKHNVACLSLYPGAVKTELINKLVLQAEPDSSADREAPTSNEKIKVELFSIFLVII